MHSEISGTLIEWYGAHKRSLPWRETTDPYLIWVSETILQQTRVAQGLDYYTRFTARFPDVRSLARADEDEVMKLWQGLGYYSRARNLHAAAKDIVERFGGRFPRSYEEVMSLKGIGRYTASAICSISYNQPHAVVDGNVYRVLSRLFAVDLPVDSPEGQKYFMSLADSLIDVERPHLYNQAIMEFGALQCVPRSPDCSVCPFDNCLAFRDKQVDRFPVKRKKTKGKDRYFNYFHVRCGGMTLLHKRTAKDIWRNLYEFPLIETGAAADWLALQDHEAFAELLGTAQNVQLSDMRSMPPHVLSHQVIRCTFYRLDVPRFTGGMKKYKAVPESETDRYPVSRLMERYLLEDPGSDDSGGEV